MSALCHWRTSRHLFDDLSGNLAKPPRPSINGLYFAFIKLALFHHRIHMQQLLRAPHGKWIQASCPTRNT
ncbi:MAG: hypothetical protein WBL98_14870, partial [Pseudolabrys sp.]